AKGAWYMLRDYPQLIAAYAASSGIYGLTLPTDAAVADRLKTIPGYFVHGLLDTKQVASATGTIVNQLNSLSSNKTFPPMARIVPGKGYESALWDNEFYNKATAKFDFEKFFLLYSKDPVYTATRYTEKLEAYIEQSKPERSLEYMSKANQLVNGLPSSSSKTSLLTRLSNAKTSLSNIYGRSFLLKCGAITVPGAINNVNDGSIGKIVPNLVDQNGIKSSYTFNIIQQGSKTPGLATPGMTNQYFGLDSLIFKDGFAIEDNGALYTFSNLKNTKRYKIVLFSSRDYTPSNMVNFPEITAVVGDTAKYISSAYNTCNYIEFSGLTPVNGEISIRVKGGWTLASGATPAYDSVSGAYIANVKDVQSYTQTG
ncbi:MAG TPA: hypothetical protein VNS32_10785, partial [Flavisolibacter sp.]|nr:hypothetical protein [Flavisolibacter sp.]